MPNTLTTFTTHALTGNRPNQEIYSPNRYPYTYAADFLRRHSHLIPARFLRAGDNPDVLSRAQASRIRTDIAAYDGIDDAEAARTLADAYLREHDIAAPDAAPETAEQVEIRRLRAEMEHIATERDELQIELDNLRSE